MYNHVTCILVVLVCKQWTVSVSMLGVNAISISHLLLWDIKTRSLTQLYAIPPFLVDHADELRFLMVKSLSYQLHPSIRNQHVAIENPLFPWFLRTPSPCILYFPMPKKKEAYLFGGFYFFCLGIFFPTNLCGVHVFRSAPPGRVLLPPPPPPPPPLTPTTFTHTSLSHTTLSHTHTTLSHTHTTLSHTTLSHTTLSHLCHIQLCHTHTTLSHTHTTLSYTTLSHTTLSHTTLSHTTLSHTQLSHTPSFTHHLSLLTHGCRFAWQARHFRHMAGSGDALGSPYLATSTFVLRGRCATSDTWLSFCVAGVALLTHGWWPKCCRFHDNDPKIMDTERFEVRNAANTV